ncbi:hypothetical protein PV11_09369 [Exophiala sideris]|uniref:Uncharacterized protein n=1 Tax=Exophiala sideris TaxID=1016849 RepID=A0A0D1VNN0_9EURO|nr:hypothetical protein PV11_09369 [Exophiala sideris]
MVLLSSHILVRTHALSLLTIAYYLLAAPYTLLSSAPIWLIGEAMSINPAHFAPEQMTINKPTPPAFRPPALMKSPVRAQTSAPAVQGTESERELLALLALVLIVYAIGQFLFAGDLAVVLPSSAPTQSNPQSRSPTKSSSRLGEELYTLLNAQSRWLTLAGLHVLGSALFVFWIYAFHSHAIFGTDNAIFPSALRLANRVTFTAGLADMLFWGYLWTVLKEEGREVGSMLARRREIEAEDE